MKTTKILKGVAIAAMTSSLRLWLGCWRVFDYR